MKEIKINSRKYKLVSSWDELSSNKFLQLAHLKCCYPNPTDYTDIFTMELMAFSILSNVPFTMHDRIDPELWPDLLKEVRWALLLPKFRENPLPKIRKIHALRFKTIELIGPQGILRHSTIEEFTSADDAFLEFHNKRNPSSAWLLLSILYRPERRDIKEFRKSPDFNGDFREPFNSFHCKERAEQLSKILPEYYAVAVCLYFESIRTHNVVQNELLAPLFSGSSGKSNDVGWINSLLEISSTKFGDFKSTTKENWILVLYELARQIDHHNKQIENAKKNTK